jgi:glycine/D-amino acid oxidase-like deaminating enzyme
MPAALMHARLMADESPAAEFRASAFHYATSFSHKLPGMTPSGTLQGMGPNMSETKLRRIALAYGAQTAAQAWWIRCLEQDQMKEICGLPLPGPALWFPTAAQVNLGALCRHLLDHRNISFEARSAPLSPAEDHVICAGTDSRGFPGCDWLEMRNVYGQLDTMMRSGATLQVPVVGNGYAIPAGDRLVVGATYEYEPWTSARATAHNLALNRHHLGGCGAWQGAARAARAITSDRHPIIGRLTDNVWIATGFGSMGATSAPFAAALILSELRGWIPPLTPAAAAAVDPQRFRQRQARRGRLEAGIDAD